MGWKSWEFQSIKLTVTQIDIWQTLSVVYNQNLFPPKFINKQFCLWEGNTGLSAPCLQNRQKWISTLQIQSYLGEELDKFKCLEAKCREKPWKVRARTYGTKSPSRSEALRFIDSAKLGSSPDTDVRASWRQRSYRSSSHCRFQWCWSSAGDELLAPTNICSGMEFSHCTAG